MSTDLSMIVTSTTVIVHSSVNHWMVLYSFFDPEKSLEGRIGVADGQKNKNRNFEKIPVENEEDSEDESSDDESNDDDHSSGASENDDYSVLDWIDEDENELS